MKTLARKSNPLFIDLFEDFFGKDFTPLTGYNTRINTPAVNIKETDSAFALQVIAPGYSKKDIALDLDENVLTISSEKKTENKNENEKFTRKEFSFNSFKRSFNLPETVNQEGVKATFKDGILNIVLPKKEEALPKPPKKIEIK